MDSGKYEQSVVFNLEEGINNGIQATPSFIVVGPDAQQERISGPQPYVIFEEMIESMLD